MSMADMGQRVNKAVIHGEAGNIGLVEYLHGIYTQYHSVKYRRVTREIAKLFTKSRFVEY